MSGLPILLAKFEPEPIAGDSSLHSTATDGSEEWTRVTQTVMNGADSRQFNWILMGWALYANYFQPAVYCLCWVPMMLSLCRCFWWLYCYLDSQVLHDETCTSQIPSACTIECEHYLLTFYSLRRSADVSKMKWRRR